MSEMDLDLTVVSGVHSPLYLRLIVLQSLFLEVQLFFLGYGSSKGSLYSSEGAGRYWRCMPW